jgi:prokaryotic ubiquitin-like protein Pup
MAQREHARRQGKSVQHTEDLAEELPAKGEQSSVADVDALLEDIDDVLEENAEDFVKSFVQKGGQ